MSRIAKKPIVIPEGVTASFDGNTLTVKGSLGELSRPFKPEIEIKIAEKEIILTPKKSSNFSKALWGTYASHILNMIEGVTKSFEKKLIIEGIGYKAELRGDKLVMNLGFSHPIELNVPKGITVTVEKENMSVSGIDKEGVGQFAAEIRSYKKPEPYKGKGIRYENEVVKRKQGKKSV